MYWAIIYVTSSPDSDYQWLATVYDIVFVDAGLASYARCYRISPLDLQEAEKPLNDPVCNDNRSYIIRFPNVLPLMQTVAIMFLAHKIPCRLPVHVSVQEPLAAAFREIVVIEGI